MKKLEKNYTHWLSSPAVNAAGRMGLFRILYSLFSLWLYSYFQFTEMTLIPINQWKPILLLSWLDSPPYQIIPLLESGLAASLILLLLGYKTRLVTISIFILGSSLAGIRMSLFMQDRLLMLQFFIPLFMMFSHWGDTYSIDSILKNRKGETIPIPQDCSWQYFWQSRGLLVIYTLLMFSSGFFKIIKKQWIVNPHFVGNLIGSKTVSSYLDNGFPINPISIFISQHGWLHIPMQYGALIFETASIFILVSPLIRFLFFRMVPLFHFSNTFLLGIGFPTAVGIYLAFPDWQTIYERFYPKYLRLTWLNRVSSRKLIVGSILSAVFVGITWNKYSFTRYVFSWFSLVTFNTIWLVIFPFVLVWAILSIYYKIQEKLSQRNTII